MNSGRRNWIKKALSLSASIPLSSALATELMAAPASRSEIEVLALFKNAPPVIRLNANENPYGPSEKARAAVFAALNEGNRYTHKATEEFRKVLAEKEGVTPDHIAIGAGSGELLCVAGVAFGLEGSSIVAPNPTFPLLLNYAEVFKAKWNKVDVNAALEVDYAELARRVNADTRLVFICNPNNPTGTYVDSNIVYDFCNSVSTTVPVYVDEAYLEFLEPAQQRSMVELVKQDKNVIVSKTFSKIYGLAGLRIGYVVARPDLIKRMTRYQMGNGVNQTAFAAAKASLGDENFMSMSRSKNAEARKILTDFLDERKLHYGKSVTNFVFFDPAGDAQQVMKRLAEEGVAIRTWDFANKQWNRISIGTVDEMNLVVKKLSQLV